jgi:hypothetical protein
MGYSTLGIALGDHTLDERRARERGQKAKTDKPIFLLIILFLSSPSPADPRIRDPTKPYRAGKAKGGNCTDPHTEAGGSRSDIRHTSYMSPVIILPHTTVVHRTNCPCPGSTR